VQERSVTTAARSADGASGFTSDRARAILTDRIWRTV